jgi:hypothetical protein
MNIPNKPTIKQAQALRTIAERGCDPSLYKMAAQTFRALNMPTAAAAMQRRADHYAKAVQS